MNDERRPYMMISLLALFFALLVSLAVFIFYLNRHGLTPFSRLILLSAGLLLSLFLLLFLLGVFVTIRALYGFYPKGFLNWILQLVISRIMPFVMRLGRMLGMDREVLEGTFIQLSNAIRREEALLRGEDLLVLVPHCVQQSHCKYRITHSADNCHRCGECQIGDLLRLKEKYGFHLKVVNGGTQARHAIKETSPKGIVAVACERDLSSGIIDTFPLPVYGVINIRPEGPCMNTKIPFLSLEEGIGCFLRREAP